MNRYLITKLLAINLAVIAFVMAVVWLSIDTLAAGYFVTLMEKKPHSPALRDTYFATKTVFFLSTSTLGKTRCS